jgi:hypothetical protein
MPADRLSATPHEALAPISVEDVTATFEDLKGMYAALIDLARALPNADAYLATRSELPPIIGEIFTQAGHATRLEHRLEKIDAALDQVGAPKSGDWDGLNVALSQVGRILRLAGFRRGENGELVRIASETGTTEGYPGIAHDLETLRTALTEIAKGEGPFSRDPLEHAGNTIDAMKKLASEALRSVK